MESDLHSIGELARDSGLGVSALRFYDGADVLTPAWVDPQTGYRWYAPGQLADARLLCRLRRVGLPLAGIRAVLGAAPAPAPPTGWSTRTCGGWRTASPMPAGSSPSSAR